MATILEAAQELIKQLNSPAVAHAVWVETTADPETKEFTQRLKVSIRPGFRVKVPTECHGWPVFNEPWPKDKGRK
jgi:hypothetical protein